VSAGAWFDRLTAPLAPRWTLKRQRARLAAELMLRHYEAASIGRRTQGWRRSATDANAAVNSGRDLLRDHARDLLRNNPWAVNGLTTIIDHTVGWGLTATSKNKGAIDAWKAWTETTACDADGRQDLAGLQKQILRTVVEAGEVLVRRRWRLPKDNLPIPLQLQVLEPDYLDPMKDSVTAGRDGTGRMVQGVQFDALGRREGYWLFDDHPGALQSRLAASRFIPASEILHIFKPERAGQVRGVSWLAPVVLRMKDFDEYEDASLMKQKIAACLAVLTSDADGSSPPLGVGSGGVGPASTIDSLEPGMILNVTPGRDVHVVTPPAVTEYSAYAQTVLRAIAAGLGIGYEDLTGDYTNLPFSAARMSRLRTWARVEDWRWRLLVPQFCGPVWGWAMQAAAIMGIVGDSAAAVDVHWTGSPMPMLEPDKEGLAYARNIRAGIITLPEAIRERGYDPDAFLEEFAKTNDRLDALKIILDSDARRTTQQGMHSGQPDYLAPTASGAAPAPTPPAPSDAAQQALIDALLATLATQPNGNGHGHGERLDPALAAKFAELREWVATRLALAERPAPAPIVVTHAPAPPPNVDARTEVHIDPGAIQTHIAPPSVTVGAPVMNVAPAELRIAEGAVRVEVAAPPPARVEVAAPVVNVAPAEVTIADGAVRVEAPVTIADGAVRTTVEAPVVHVAPAEVRIEDGAVRVDIAAPPAPNIEVAAPVVNVAPAEVRIEPGAVHVEAPVTVQPAEVRIEPGAVQVDAPVTVHPAVVQVDAPTTIEPGAVRVDAPISVTPPPSAPITVQAQRPMRRMITRDAKGRITGVTERPDDDPHGSESQAD
jgi:lambda family phage portal protein